MRRLGRLGATVAVAGALVSAAGSAAAEPASPEPPGNVYVVTDSVGLGAAQALPAAFPGRSVIVDGTPALFVELLEQRLVRPRIASNPGFFQGATAVVAGGYNYPYWDPARFDASIDGMIATLRAAGVSHVLWVMLREVDPRFVTPSAWRQVQPYSWYFPTVNDHLRAALGRHPELSLVDWATASNLPGLTYDAIHLNRTGAAVYSGTVAQVTASVGTRLPAGSITRVEVVGVAGIPADARAAALNIAAVNPRTAGYVTAFPCGGPVPFTANLHHDPALDVSGGAIAALGDDGAVCLFNSAATNLVVDVQGWFGDGDGFTPVGPVRARDTRERGARLRSFEPLEIDPAAVPGMPGAPSGVVVNLTVTEPLVPGYVTAYPCGSPVPLAANLVHRAGATGSTVPNMAVVAPGVDGKVCVVASSPAHLVVDVLGAFTADAPISMGSPRRLLDTRDGTGTGAGGTVGTAARLGPGQVARVQVTDGTGAADGAFVDLAAVDPAGGGFLRAFPCDGPMPATANLNTSPIVTVANFVLVAPGADGSVCVFSSVETDVVVDASGLTAGFHAVGPARLLDTRASAG